MGTLIKTITMNTLIILCTSVATGLSGKEWAIIIAALIAFTGVIITNILTLRSNKKTLTHSQNVLGLAVKEFHSKKLDDRKKYLLKQLNEFYRPLENYLEKSNGLFQIFRANKPKNFRTLTFLLNPKMEFESYGQYELTANDKALMNQILEIGKAIEMLILEKSGLIDDPALKNPYKPDSGITDIQLPREMSLLQLTQIHFSVIRLAYEGNLTGEARTYEPYVYPKELNRIITGSISKVNEEIKDIEEQLYV